MASTICDCLAPVELADMSCGACGLRRLGDDLTSGQVHALAVALTAHFEGTADRPVFLRRVKGRKRPRDWRA